ncbi:MAG TPA: DUF1272 domain-containing protein [Roseiarcus sp.]
MALELRPNCECCDRDLPPASLEARTCTSRRGDRLTSPCVCRTSAALPGSAASARFR